MTKGRQKFLDFVLARVQPGKEDEAKKIMGAFFVKQDADALTSAFIQQTEWSIILMLRPECVEEFKRVGQA